MGPNRRAQERERAVAPEDRQFIEHLVPAGDALLAFIDDTGDPAYRDPVNPVFGLGGCVVLARDLDRLIRHPWRDVRTALAGSATATVHATEAEWRLSKVKEIAIRTFFNEQPFRRVAYITSVRTGYVINGQLDDVVVRSTAAALIQRIIDVAKWMPFTSIAVIFEHSKRLELRLQNALGGLSFRENGRFIPHEWCWMRKSAAEPALEVADFMMHSIAGYCRSGRNPQNKFAARFSSIFGVSDERLVSFLEGDCIIYTSLG
jgi:hypothetical protein